MDENKDKDQQLFTKIAIDVREHPNRYSRAGKYLDKYYGEKRQIPQIRRFVEVRQDLLKKYEKQDFIPEDDAIRILLITWLLTDADAQKTNPNITLFAGWPWKPTDDITSGSRCAASSLWYENAYSYELWMRLVRIAWKTVETQKQAETERKIAPAKRCWIKKIAGCIFKKTRHFIGAISVSLIVAVLIAIFGEFGWLERIKAFIYNILQLE